MQMPLHIGYMETLVPCGCKSVLFKDEGVLKLLLQSSNNTSLCSLDMMFI